MSKIKIKQIRSIIDRPKRQKLTIEALGLGRPNWEVVHNDNPQIRGMVNKVSHLVEVEDYKEDKPVKKKTVPKKESKKSDVQDDKKTEEPVKKVKSEEKSPKTGKEKTGKEKTKKVKTEK